MVIGILMVGFLPKALIVMVPDPVTPPQRPAFKYAWSWLLAAPFDGITSITCVVLVTLLLDTVYE